MANNHRSDVGPVTEIPEAAGRPLIIEYGDARRKAGTIESATRNDDGSVTIIAATETGYFAAKTSNPFINFSIDGAAE